MQLIVAKPKKTYFNKDDNIHKSEALKWKDKRTLTLVECQNSKLNINAYVYSKL